MKAINEVFCSVIQPLPGESSKLVRDARCHIVWLVTPAEGSRNASLELSRIFEFLINYSTGF